MMSEEWPYFYDIKTESYIPCTPAVVRALLAQQLALGKLRSSVRDLALQTDAMMTEMSKQWSTATGNNS